MTTQREDRFSPPAALVALCWAAFAGVVAWLVALVVTAADPAGALIAGAAGLALLLVALFGTVARPRLAVDDAGIAVRGLLRTRRYAWSELEGFRVLRTRRWGIGGSLLELDVRDGRLLVLGRLDLGADPEEVAGTLRAHRGADGAAG